MHITTRNLFLLLRAGAFGQQDRLEPMSAWKWRKTYQLAVAHGVEAEAYEGLEVVSDQFFAQLVPDELRSQWADCAAEARRRSQNRSTELPARLSKQLDNIVESYPEATVEHSMLEGIMLLSYSLLTDDCWVLRLLALGEQVREMGQRVNRELLQKWLRQTRLARMAQLEGAMLVMLMGVQPEELPMAMPRRKDAINAQVDAIASAIPHGREQWQFEQGKNIFVHTTNASAMVWNARRAARFFAYSPRESLNQLFSSFRLSLKNIEE